MGLASCACTNALIHDVGLISRFSFRRLSRNPSLFPGVNEYAVCSSALSLYSPLKRSHLGNSSFNFVAGKAVTDSTGFAVAACGVAAPATVV